MKTVLELSKELNISKQKLYRYIKRHHINEVHREADVMYIDEALETILKSVFFNDDTSSEAHQTTSKDTDMMQFLKDQIEEKDEQIRTLQRLLEQQQILSAQANKKIELLENKEKEEDKYEKTWFGFYKKLNKGE